MRITIAMPKLDNKPFRIYMKSKYVVSLMKTAAYINNNNSHIGAEALQNPSHSLAT